MGDSCLGVIDRLETVDVDERAAERTPTASVSMGLAALQNSETLEELTARADADLYAVRRRAHQHAESKSRPAPS
jgi:hypothetical protein